MISDLDVIRIKQGYFSYSSIFNSTFLLNPIRVGLAAWTGIMIFCHRVLQVLQIPTFWTIESRSAILLTDHHNVLFSELRSKESFYKTKNHIFIPVYVLLRGGDSFIRNLSPRNSVRQHFHRVGLVAEICLQIRDHFTKLCVVLERTPNVWNVRRKHFTTVLKTFPGLKRGRRKQIEQGV
jgi:hypothetical protein